MTKYLYNTTQDDLTYIGKTISAQSYYIIQSNLEIKFANEDAVLADIANATLIVSKSDDSSGHITSINDAINYLKGNLPAVVENTQYPFSAKILQTGKKIFTRMHGKKFTINNSGEDLDFTVPYIQCKITGIEIIGAEEGDKVQFKVIDDANGTYSGTPNQQLNQFGFDVYPSINFYNYKSNYDADLYYGMKLRLTYDSKDVVLDPSRDIYINYILHEVTD